MFADLRVIGFAGFRQRSNDVRKPRKQMFPGLIGPTAFGCALQPVALRRAPANRIVPNPKNWQRLVGSGSAQFQYDASGQLASVLDPSNPVEAEFDVEGRLSRLVAGTIYDVKYDHAGRLASFGAEQYLYDVAEVVSTSVGTASESTLYGVTLDDRLAVDGSLPVVDEFGTSQVSFALDGSIQANGVLDAWGRVRAGTAGSRSIYAGSPQLAGSVYAMRARFYLPSVGRFVSEDPVRDPSLSTYAYAASSPTMKGDWSGRVASKVVINPAVGLPFSLLFPKCDYKQNVKGCVRGRAGLDCECRCSPGFVWHPSITMSLELGVYAITDHPTVTYARALEQEGRHLDSDLTHFYLLEATARAFEAVPYSSWVTCKAACLAFEQGAKLQWLSREFVVDGLYIDLTHDYDDVRKQRP